MIPSQKTGVDCPRRAPVIPMWSRMEFLLMAEMIPTGMAISKARMRAAKVS